MNRDQIILTVLSVVYARVLRDILVQAVSSTQNELDDKLVAMLDVLFDYGQ